MKKLRRFWSSRPSLCMFCSPSPRLLILYKRETWEGTFRYRWRMGKEYKSPVFRASLIVCLLLAYGLIYAAFSSFHINPFEPCNSYINYFLIINSFLVFLFALILISNWFSFADFCVFRKWREAPGVVCEW